MSLDALFLPSQACYKGKWRVLVVFFFDRMMDLEGLLELTEVRPAKLSPLSLLKTCMRAHTRSTLIERYKLGSNTPVGLFVPDDGISERNQGRKVL